MPTLEQIEPNLYIQTHKSGNQSWVLRIQKDGKRTLRSLGDVRFVSKRQAKEDAHRIAMAIRLGEERAQKRCAPTFSEILQQALDDIQEVKCWKKPEVMRHRCDQLIQDYIEPYIGDMPVDKIEPDDIADALRPAWKTHTPSASLARSYTEDVFSWCILKKYRKSPNPATWKSNLELLLAPKSKVHKTKSFAAPTMADMKTIIEFCRENPGIVSGAVLLTIATVGRMQEVVKAERSEFTKDTWTPNIFRMKVEKQHSVPLIPLAKEALKMADKGNILFPGSLGSKYIAMDSPRKKIRDITLKHITAHGIRSTFKSWAARNGIDEIVSEKCLSHAWGNKTTEAYLRDDLLDRRRKALIEWVKACERGED